MTNTFKKANKKTFWQFIRFGIVGVMNTLITLIVIYILQKICNVDYKIANVVGYIAGVINSFFWSKLWVFRKLSSNFIHEVILFLISFGICYGIQFITLLVLVEKLQIPDMWAQLLGMIVYTLCNFTLNKFITFKK